jgi:Tol biopolymer transport system component
VSGTSQPTWIARNGTRQGTVGPPGPHDSFDLSPDGRTLATDRHAGRETSIWLIDVERGTSTRFTSDAYSATPRWSPQGDGLVFVSARDTPPNPFIRTLAGAERRLARLPRAAVIEDWTPDGKWVIGEFLDVKTGWDLWLFATSGDKAPEVFLQTPFGERCAVISPDGRSVAFTSDESGTNEVYVTSFPRPGRRVRVSTAGGESPRWNGDGTELFLQAGKKIMAVGVTPAVAGSVPGIGLPRELFTLPEGAGYWIAARDGQRFLVDIEVTKAVPPPVQVVVNWRTRSR